MFPVTWCYNLRFLKVNQAGLNKGELTVSAMIAGELDSGELSKAQVFVPNIIEVR